MCLFDIIRLKRWVGGEVLLRDVSFFLWIGYFFPCILFHLCMLFFLSSYLWIYVRARRNDREICVYQSLMRYQSASQPARQSMLHRGPLRGISSCISFLYYVGERRSKEDRIPSPSSLVRRSIVLDIDIDLSVVRHPFRPPLFPARE